MDIIISLSAKLLFLLVVACVRWNFRSQKPFFTYVILKDLKILFFSDKKREYKTFLLTLLYIAQRNCAARRGVIKLNEGGNYIIQAKSVFLSLSFKKKSFTHVIMWNQTLLIRHEDAIFFCFILIQDFSGSYNFYLKKKKKLFTKSRISSYIERIQDVINTPIKPMIPLI